MIRDDATQRQVNAANPKNSTWLAANAGSGKTRVLTDRVARLLLEKVDPQNILCLTYTKAAAAEMQNRLFKRLGEWAMLADGALRKDLDELGFERDITAEEIANARTLFARAIETPGGLKIQTIHSFCASILRRFPLEAQVSPQFREMEDRSAALLRTEVLDAIATGEQADVLQNMLRYFSGAELDKLVASISAKRGYFLVPLDEPKLRKTLEIGPNDETNRLLAEVFNEDTREIIKDTVVACRTGSSTDITAAGKLGAVNILNPSIGDLKSLQAMFLFGPKTKNPLSAKIGKFPTKATREANPDLAEALDGLMQQIEDTRETSLALSALDRTRALYAFATVFVPAYEARKLALGMLDFDDLITKTRALLTDKAVAQWVLFRLDGGIDHLLVDEAQDTSPDQWAVIEELTREFSAGEGARSNNERTIFVVGDKQQSIYSFQGADPAAFDEMQHHFTQELANVGNKLHTEGLEHSFRSSQAILRLVDNTFERERGEAIGKTQNHIAFKADMPGRVDLWPVIEKTVEEKSDKEWFEPVDKQSDAHHTVQLANQVAAQIKRMIRQETIPVEIGHSGTYNHRKITEGDFLILVQRRSELFSEIIRACKAADLAIAGADRLRVGAELAVKDLAALLNFLALPEDDLSLACALRSPLFGWTEQQLFTLSHHREEKFLWAALRNSDHLETLAVLKDLRKQADFLRPYDLIERILTRHMGRQKLLARLGTEAEDGIDALLSQSLAYESSGVPSLTGFLTWMQTDDLEVKRQMDAQGDRIRVMTVHGAKGLEAPIVILPDTGKRKKEAKAELFPADGQLVWKTPSAESAESVTALKDDIIAAQERERLRLLYVAMTRAEKWLIVAAAGEVDEDSWYSIVADGMEHSGCADAQSGDLEIQRMAHENWLSGVRADPIADVVTVVDLPNLPDIQMPEKKKTIAPSDLGGDKIIAGDPAGDDVDDALARGRLVHLMLEHLPNVPADKQLEVAKKILASGPDADPQATHLPLAVSTLIQSPALQHIFGPDALAEVDITAVLPTLDARVHGSIDRLIIKGDHILAIDYKTNRLVPDTPEKTPEGLLRQMGAYAEALAQIYPNHTIETAILWTETTTLMTLPSALTKDALGRVTVP